MESSSNKKSVLITGAGGFIGSNIVKAFLNDSECWDVHVLVHKSCPKELSKAKIIRGNLEDITTLHGIANCFDIVVHCAGLAKDIGNYEKFKKINYDPIEFLPEFAKEKFIFISTTDVYGIKDFKNADESTPFCEFPKNPYPHYKIMCEEYLQKHCKNYVIIRPAAVWGENDKTLENRVIEFLKVSPFIVHFGKWRGKNRWPLANVENVAKTVLSVAKFNEFNNEAINIIDKKFTTIDEYYEQIGQKYFPNKKFRRLYLPLWFGKFLGLISTIISNLRGLKEPWFDPTFYAVHHVSSNLDFSSKKMEQVLSKLDHEYFNQNIDNNF